MRVRSTVRPPDRGRRGPAAVLAALLIAGLAGCTPPDVTGTVSEPTTATQSADSGKGGADGSGSAKSQESDKKKSDGSGNEKKSGGSGKKTDDDAAATAGKGTALAALADLAVKGRAPKTGYDRDQFGPSWADVDRNGCDTRNDILTRDLTRPVYEAGTHECVVLTGRLADPYTATVIDFQRGQDTSIAVQIDHAVALSDAWQKGAQQIDEDVRRQMANDPLNLFAVDGPTNGAKGDGDAATWLPPNKSFRCQYVARQIAVKKTYELWVTQAEHDAMARVLSSCRKEPLPSGGLAPEVKANTAKKTETQKASPTPEPEQEPESVYYENCTAARDAGAAPVRKGDPGYAGHLDRDGDGVGCE